MSLTINATPGDPAANAYADKAYASAYASARRGSDDWNDADASDQVMCLVQATRILDSTYDWNGWQSTDTQALLWPRSWAVNYDQAFGLNSMFDFDSTLASYYPDNVIPKSVKDATCELAIWLLSQSSYAAQAGDPKSVRVGPVRVDFDMTIGQWSIPNTVIEMLRKMGNFRGQTAGGAVMTATLVRT